MEEVVSNWSKRSKPILKGQVEFLKKSNLERALKAANVAIKHNSDVDLVEWQPGLSLVTAGAKQEKILGNSQKISRRWFSQI